MADGGASVLVIYESVYGNTRQIAEAIAAGIAESEPAEAIPVHSASRDRMAGAAAVVVGGPTHMHGLASSTSRAAAIQAGEEDGVQIEPGARENPTLRSWLTEQDDAGTPAAAFDTRIDKSPVLTGQAARGIAKRLRRRGFEVIADPVSFFVDDSEGPLAEGELERAQEWGRNLAGRLGTGAL